MRPLVFLSCVRVVVECAAARTCVSQLVAVAGVPVVTPMHAPVTPWQAEASVWWPHLQVIPLQVNNAFHFSEADLAALAGTNLGTLALAMQRQLRQDYARIFPTLFDRCGDLGLNFRTFSLDAYRWAVSTM